jgi:hypothetical protein
LFIREWFRGDPQADQKRWEAAETLRPIGQVKTIVNGTLDTAVPVFYRQQDEYCEWFAEKDASGRVVKVSFTAEGPEYWEFIASGTKPFFNKNDPRGGLAAGDPTQLVQLYQQILGNNAIVKEDLYWQTDVAIFDDDAKKWVTFAEAGDYNKYNKWNTTHGAVHLTHPANTLGAEVNLAARATVLRFDEAKQPIKSAEPLICCSGYGSVMRSSDPSIGNFVNGFARQGLSASLANPVGLYIAELLPGISGKNGANVSSGWKTVRGSEDQQMILRAEFQVPPQLGFAVSDCVVGGQPIRFGGQIADLIKMKLTGAAKKMSEGPFPPLSCVRHCCGNSKKPTVKNVFSTRTQCSALDDQYWNSIAPTPPQGAISFTAASFAGAVTTEARIDPKPAYTASRARSR